MRDWLYQVLSSTEFWAALFGALAAFLLEAIRRRRNENLANATAINLTLSRLGQMYNLLKNYHDQAFVEPMQQLRTTLGHEPSPILFKPLVGMGEPDLRIPHEQLGVLMRSHDPDIVNRIYGAERGYLGFLAQMREHTSLHHKLQHRMSAGGFDANAMVPVEVVQRLVGYDLFKQVEDIAMALRDQLPQTYREILEIQSQLHGVAKAHFPTRKFIRIKPIDRSPISKIHNTRKPNWWRRIVFFLYSTNVPPISKRRPP